MTKTGRILILFCNIFHDINFTQLFYVRFVIKGVLKLKMHVQTSLCMHILPTIIFDFD